MSDTNLRLQVVLNAVDKLTRPFREAKASTKGLAAAIQASRSQLKGLDAQAARIDGFRKTNTQLGITARNLKAAKEEAAALAVQFTRTSRPTAQQARLLEQAKNRASELQQKYNGLRLAVQRQREALSASGTDTRKLSQAQRELKAQADETRIALDRQQQSLRRLGEQQKKMNAVRERYRHAQDTRNRLLGNGAVMTATGSGVLYGSQRMLTPGADFEQGMSKVQALTRLDKNSDEIAALREQARQLGASTAFTANDVAQGQSFYAMAGFRPEQIRAAMPATLSMSLAGDTDLATTADIGSNILTGFKLQADQMSRASDSLVATFTRSNTTLQMLGETMKYVAPVAATLGVDLETAAAATGKLGDAGIQGSQAGTSLRAILARLASPPKEAAAALEEMNIRAKDAHGNLRPFVDLLSEMYAKTRNMGNARQAELFKHVAGEEAFSGLSVLVQQAGNGQLQKLVAEIRAAQGEADKVAGTMADNLRGDMKNLSSAWEDVGITLFDSVDSPLRGVTQRVTALTAKAGAWMKAHPGLTRVITGTALALGALVAVMGGLTLAIAAIIGPIALLRFGAGMLSLKGLATLTPVLSGLGKAFTGLVPGLSKSGGGLKKLFALFSGGEAATSVSWMEKIRAAIAAMTRRDDDADGIAGAFREGVLESIKDRVLQTGEVITTAFRNPLAAVRASVARLKVLAGAAFAPVVASVRAAGGAIRWLVMSPFALLRTAVMAMVSVMGALLSPVGLLIAALAGVALVIWKYWNPIKAYLSGVVEGFRAAAAPISEAFSPLMPVFQWIGDKVQALFGWFRDLLSPVQSTAAELDSAAAKGKAFGQAMADGLSMVMHPLDTLKTGVSWLLDKLGLVTKEAANAKLPEHVTRQRAATVNTDGKVVLPPGGFPMMGYAGMYDTGGIIPAGQFGVVGENGPEIVNGPVSVTSRRRTAQLATMAALTLGTAAAPVEALPLHPLSLPVQSYREEAPRQPVIQQGAAPQIHASFTIVQQPGESQQSLVDEVMRRLEAKERQAQARARSNYRDRGGFDE